MRRRTIVFAIALVSAVSLAWGPAPTLQGSGRSAVKIGMMQSIFRDMSASKLAGMKAVFNRFVEEQTGLKAELKLMPSADEMRQELNNGELQVAAFQGFEFAWIKLQDRDLQPLMVVGVQPANLKTVLVIAKDSPYKSLADLRGKTIAIPAGTRDYHRLYLTRRCRSLDSAVEEFFSKETSPGTVEDALDDVADGKADVALADQGSVHAYSRRKPGRCANLKGLEQSHPFAPSVIAYAKGKVDESTLQRFRRGMTTAHTTNQGSLMMSLLKIKQFEPVPDNWDQVLAESVKHYPPPH